MPGTSIDQDNHITSIRLKVPTGTVPIPPEGYGQLHTTGEGGLAVRLPDGGVVPVGGEPATPRSIAGTGGGVSADSAPGIIDGLTIAVPPGKHLWFNVPDVLFGPDQLPFGVQVAPPVIVTSAEIKALHTTPKMLVAAPGAGQLNVPVKIVLVFTNGVPYTGGGLLYVGYQQDDGSVLNEWQEPPGPMVTGGQDQLTVVPCDSLLETPALTLGKALALTNLIADYEDGTGTLLAVVSYMTLSA